MNKSILSAICATITALALLVAPAQADTNIWTGKVVHVSTSNLKVNNADGNQTLSFLLVPKFKQVFSDDGKTTVQMAELKPGTWVTIYYDQDLLGARHADKIVILKSDQQIKT